MSNRSRRVEMFFALTTMDATSISSHPSLGYAEPESTRAPFALAPAECQRLA